MFVTKVAVIGDDDLADAIAGAGFEVARDLAGVGGADLVLTGEPDLGQVDALAPGHAVLAVLTTGSVTELADITSRPEQVVGFHLAGKRLVEIVEGLETSPEVAQAAANFAQAIRRAPIRCADVPGFVATRIGEAADPLAEACAVLEEDVAGLRDIDAAMAATAGTRPFADADKAGLDTLTDPPRIVRRLLAAGRTGASAGQGFYPYPRPDEGYEDALAKLETRDEIGIIWLDGPPANSLGPDMVAALEHAWEAVEQHVRALVIASANPGLFCAGADIKAFAAMDDCKTLLDRMHGLLRAFEDSRVATIAAVNGLALGGGCELAMGCDVRLAAFSATFGQPEINLGLIPGFGGTQRLQRLVGTAKALEMNLTGDAISAEDAFQHGLANRVVADQDLFDVALAWAAKLAGKSPKAIQTIKQVSRPATLEEGLAAEKQGFAAAFGSEDGREGVAAFVEKRRAVWRGR